MSTYFGNENAGLQIAVNHGPVYFSSDQPKTPQEIDNGSYRHASPELLLSMTAELLRSLVFSQMLDRRDNIEPRHINTCEWILELDEYKSWRSQPRGLLWIKRNPGTGKSTMMAFLYEQLEQERDQGIRLDFFFTARGTEMQYTPLGMFRSLLSQIFNGDFTSRPKLRKLYEQRCREFGGQKWEWPRVVLEKLLANVILESTSRWYVTISVDALDEAGAESAQQIAVYFNRLIDRAGKAAIYVCISCRYYPIVKSARTVEVHMEDHNHDDIAAYIKGTLMDTDVRDSPSEDSEMQKLLVK
ncbi:hypothetical protein N7509_002207 [Penicillium cosmopolitanum]|uniref:Nephrocystin 3-like N-terminal domain-containing protein n=1 Tax=Penicillium cosmopolitanum TaxID=1131564 RepID=A0A9W9W8M2_9EURO|nr:uncharacterized protein N7509_002207 [Penicillium cosmopolitanum]KAJ5408324.1 hypothetical protein N7509_002207 [Penicillium cosmopolitanum]